MIGLLIVALIVCFMIVYVFVPQKSDKIEKDTKNNPQIIDQTPKRFKRVDWWVDVHHLFEVESISLDRNKMIKIFGAGNYSFGTNDEQEGFKMIYIDRFDQNCDYIPIHIVNKIVPTNWIVYSNDPVKAQQIVDQEVYGLATS